MGWAWGGPGPGRPVRGLEEEKAQLDRTLRTKLVLSLSRAANKGCWAYMHEEPLLEQEEGRPDFGKQLLSSQTMAKCTLGVQTTGGFARIPRCISPSGQPVEFSSIDSRPDAYWCRQRGRRIAVCGVLVQGARGLGFLLSLSPVFRRGQRAKARGRLECGLANNVLLRRPIAHEVANVIQT